MKKLSILLIVALLSAMFVLPAAAQSITWTSGFQVQNLSGTDASIFIYYYNQDGTEAIPPVSDTIPAMGSKTYFPIHAADGFNGSVVVESTEPVVAIANTLGNSPQYMASTESFDAGATSVNLPLIMRGNAGYYTWFNVQNAGTTDATVTVEYIPAEGSAYTEPAVVIKPGASHTFNQRDIDALGAKFVGSAIVSSDVPVVATVMQVGETFQNMMGYNGFTGGSTTVSMPLIMANNSGFYTGFQVQNVGSQAATVTVDYGANIGGSFDPTNETATLNPGESTTFLQNAGQFATPKYVGSATISSDQPVVAIVNQVMMSGVVLGTAYNGFDPGAATNSVSAPLIMANNNGFYTGIQVMNVGGAPVSITLDYGPNTAGTYNPPNETATIQPGDSYNSIQNAGAWAGNKYVGSLAVSAPDGSQIVMIVNEFLASASDTFMTYNGFNY
ncbi:MAG: hypothetical protein GX597_11575 [Anaerolineaceae bacterium]|nr:hypothetical protein [Anaerolineaceae bacterium]